jgi:hypothetical protein
LLFGLPEFISMHACFLFLIPCFFFLTIIHQNTSTSIRHWISILCLYLCTLDVS